MAIRAFFAAAISALTLLQPHGAVAQVRLDRADPTITEQSLPKPEVERPERSPAPRVEPGAPRVDASAKTGVVTAVTVTGAEGIAPSAYADVLANVVGNTLSRKELGELANAIAGVVRARGYPFATGSIEPQSMAGGVLRVTIDQGRIDAVRVVGARNAAADRLLVATLANRRPVTQAALERALLLVGDLPGVTVKDSRFVRQDGFGILLVTIAQDRASGFAQLDNRGSREVGPIRSTLLGNLRGVAHDGDELGVVVAQTPFEPSEFAFLRARYGTPLGKMGSQLSVSASLGRTHPGALLAPLDVRGRSADVALSYLRPLIRRKAGSLWAAAELRAVATEQTLRGRRLRFDRLTTLTGSLNGVTALGGGALRGELFTVLGLPLPGMSRAGDALLSRDDGDGRFAAVGYQAEWSARIARPFSIALASAGQLASRPLLATAEIGLGGPTFGRAYDYAERTGDRGVMGSAELRADAGRLLPGVVERAQAYAFVDGGVVGNLRRGIGGGALGSGGVGVRGGVGRLDAMAEVAFPLSGERLDTGDRRPRISLRLSRSF